MLSLIIIASIVSQTVNSKRILIFKNPSKLESADPLKYNILNNKIKKFIQILIFKILKMKNLFISASDCTFYKHFGIYVLHFKYVLYLLSIEKQGFHLFFFSLPLPPRSSLAPPSPPNKKIQFLKNPAYNKVPYCMPDL